MEEPGCKRVRITPHMCDLKWVKGTYPTPYGILEIEHLKQESGEIKTVVRGPKEVKIVIE